MWVDFPDINKAILKDYFSLPSINQLVDATVGLNLLSFMDAYSGYHQIRMHSEDKEKTSFIIEEGTFCYTMMPFVLKNAGLTYQHLVSKMFEGKLGQNIEVYVTK